MSCAEINRQVLGRPPQRGDFLRERLVLWSESRADDDDDDDDDDLPNDEEPGVEDAQQPRDAADLPSKAAQTLKSPLFP